MRFGVLAALVCASMLSACAAAPESAEKEMATVSGTVMYLQRMALPPEAIIIVRLQDVSRMDAPALVIGEQRIEMSGRQVPIPFEIAYDPARIDERMTYTVSARVEQDGKLLMINDTAFPAITRGAPASGIEVRVVPVR